MLRLRVAPKQIAPRFDLSEQILVDLVVDHRADEVDVGLEGLLVDGQPPRPDVRLEPVEHRRVDDETPVDDLAVAPLDRDPRVAGGDEPLGEGDELAPRRQQPPEARRIETLDRPREEVIRLDAAPAVDRAAGVGVLAVGRRANRRFRLAQGIGEVLVEGGVPRPLDHPAARREVAGGGQRKARAVAHPVDGLHERLAESGLSDDQPAIVVLDGARDDLRRARAVAVDEHDERLVDVAAGVARVVVLVGVGDAAARVDDHVAARQELVRDLDGLIEGPAGIAAQVEQEPRGALAAERREGPRQLLVARLREVAEAHVAGRLVDQERRLDGRDADFVPLDAQVDQLLVPVAAHGDVHRAAARPPQQANRLVAAHPDRVLALDARDDVAAPDPAPVGGRPLEEAVDRDAAVDDGDLYSEPVVAPLLPLPQAGVLPGVHEVRMRIQRLQHAADGPRHELLDVDLVDVVGFDRGERRRERVVLPGHRILARQHLTAEQPARDGRQDDGAHPDRSRRH